MMDMSYQNKSREELIEALRQLEKENRELQHAISKGADMQTITENGEMVRLSEECFREVLENSIDASYKRNLHTSMYDYLSPVFIQICGYTADEMNAMPLDMVLGLMHPDDVFK
jgi:PAS domain-containing protein